MEPLIQRECSGRRAHIAYSTKADGDLSPSTVPARELQDRRQRAIAYPWCAVRQVHSDRVIVASHASLGAARQVADALVTTDPGLVVAVHSGDCVPVGFIADRGVVAAAHAGWKGLEAGVLESTVRRIRQLAPTGQIVAGVGPHIRAERYAFGAADLDRLARRFGSQVIATTERGTPALDLTAGVVGELARLDVCVTAVSDACTSRDRDAFWSHRARQEPGRIALAAWLEPS